MGAVRMALEMVPLDVTTGVEPEPTLGWVPTLIVGPNMMTVYGEGGSESDEDLYELEEEFVWGLSRL